MFVVSDTEKIFLPQPEDLIVNVSDSFDIINSLLDNLPNYFTRSTSQESCLFSALHSATTILRANGGKMVVFQMNQSITRHSLLAPKPA